MISHDEFRNLYQTQFEPEVKKLERARLRPLISAAISIIAVVRLIFNWSDNSFGFGLLLVIVAVVLGYHAFFTYRDYRRSYKHKVVARVIKLVDPDYKFFYDHHIPFKTFIKSGLFYEYPQSYEGDDYVSGTIEDCTFEFSEIHASHGTGEGKTVVFGGLFLKIGLGRDINNQVYLFPDRSDIELGDYYQRKQLEDRGNRVRMTSDKFERKFSVFSPKTAEARSLLVPDTIDVIMEMQKLIDKKISLSFVGSDFYCTIPYDGTIFEPELFYGSVQPGAVMDVYRHFKLIERIVHMLKQIERNTKTDTPAPAIVLTPDSSPPSTTVPSVEDSAEEEEVQSTPLIDQTLKLPVLQESILKFQETAPDRDLKTYLLAVYSNILALQEEVLTQELLTRILSDSFTSEAMALDESWLAISIKPERDKMYRKAKSADDIGSFTRPEHTGWSDFEFTEEVLRFQIAELHKMEGNQLENQMKEYGVASETGTPWYNFDPVSNLDSGIQQLIDQEYHVDAIDWSIIGLIFQHGRINA